MNLSYDVVKDFEPVSLIADTPLWIVADKDLPADDLKEFDRLAQIRRRQGERGLGRHRRPDRSRRPVLPEADRHALPVRALSRRRAAAAGPARRPYRLHFRTGSTYLPYVRNGQLKAFAVLTPKRWWAAPEVPTLDELGVQGIYASFWHGIWAPKGTPKPIIDKLNAA